MLSVILQFYCFIVNAITNLHPEWWVHYFIFQELCEKCRTLGFYCRRINISALGEGDRSDTPQTPFNLVNIKQFNAVPSTAAAADSFPASSFSQQHLPSSSSQQLTSQISGSFLHQSGGLSPEFGGANFAAGINAAGPSFSDSGNAGKVSADWNNY